MIPLTNPSEKSIKSIVDTNQHKHCIQCGNKKITAKGLCRNCYQKQHYKNNPEKHERKKQMNLQWNLNNPERVNESQKKCRLRYWEKYPEKKEVALKKFKQNINKSVICNILKKHAEELKDDPEHLTTEFLQKLIGIKCKNPKKN